jgi:hypothetical protein
MSTSRSFSILILFIDKNMEASMVIEPEKHNRYKSSDFIKIDGKYIRNLL